MKTPTSRSPGTAARPGARGASKARLIDAKAREEQIREAAYFRAERRGFQVGHELEDWLAAERDFERWLATRGAPRRYAR